MKIPRGPLLLAAALVIPSCQPKIVPPPAPLPQARPLERTFGALTVSGSSKCSIQYKAMILGVNEVPSSPADYLLFSGVESVPSLSGVRPSQKILAPSAALPGLNKKGFAFTKDLAVGRMIQFSKEGALVLARAYESQVNNRPAKTYMLEFDNGRNLLFVPEGLKADDLRPFLYSLRDEGKEIHLALVPNASETDAAEIVGLFQPQEAVMTGFSSNEARGNFMAKLKDQFFQGALIFAKPGDTIPF